MTNPNVRDGAVPPGLPDSPDPAATAALADQPVSRAQQALTERNRALQLIHSGRPATATVDALHDTGARVNGRAVTEVRLLVDRPDGGAYPVVRAALAPAPDADLATMAVASSGRPRRIPVLVDPGRPHNVLLRWDLRPAS
ncbi:conserved hypothetical protein [Frankia sp. AiPs1]|uniref:hypothetical protein n=1 Tax=Frankia sp. AiPa1 TaxID=573492 RepID=UPI00202ADDED|nr:hypothetical protein [Frankia sp. AiPa1]MCL9762407.1 hypothetical protein [Frankia sp. AiPa1]